MNEIVDILLSACTASGRCTHSRRRHGEGRQQHLCKNARPNPRLQTLRVRSSGNDTGRELLQKRLDWAGRRSLHTRETISNAFSKIPAARNKHSCGATTVLLPFAYRVAGIKQTTERWCEDQIRRDTGAGDADSNATRMRDRMEHVIQALRHEALR